MEDKYSNVADDVSSNAQAGTNKSQDSANQAKDNAKSAYNGGKDLYNAGQRAGLFGGKAAKSAGANAANSAAGAGAKAGTAGATGAGATGAGATAGGATAGGATAASGTVVSGTAAGGTAAGGTVAGGTAVGGTAAGGTGTVATGTGLAGLVSNPIFWAVVVIVLLILITVMVMPKDASNQSFYINEAPITATTMKQDYANRFTNPIKEKMQDRVKEIDETADKALADLTKSLGAQGGAVDVQTGGVGKEIINKEQSIQDAAETFAVYSQSLMTTIEHYNPKVVKKGSEDFDVNLYSDDANDYFAAVEEYMNRDTTLFLTKSYDVIYWYNLTTKIAEYEWTEQIATGTYDEMGEEIYTPVTHTTSRSETFVTAAGKGESGEQLTQDEISKMGDDDGTKLYGGLIDAVKANNNDNLTLVNANDVMFEQTVVEDGHTYTKVRETTHTTTNYGGTMYMTIGYNFEDFLEKDIKNAQKIIEDGVSEEVKEYLEEQNSSAEISAATQFERFLSEQECIVLECYMGVNTRVNGFEFHISNGTNAIGYLYGNMDTYLGNYDSNIQYAEAWFGTTESGTAGGLIPQINASWETWYQDSTTLMVDVPDGNGSTNQVSLFAYMLAMEQKTPNLPLAIYNTAGFVGYSRYQCVGWVKGFLFDRYGTTYGNNGNGNEMATNLYSRYPDEWEQGSANLSDLRAGAVISTGPTKIYGHVFYVSKVEADANGNITRLWTCDGNLHTPYGADSTAVRINKEWTVGEFLSRYDIAGVANHK